MALPSFVSQNTIFVVIIGNWLVKRVSVCDISLVGFTMDYVIISTADHDIT